MRTRQVAALAALLSVVACSDDATNHGTPDALAVAASDAGLDASDATRNGPPMPRSHWP